MEHLKKFKLYNESFVHKNNSDDITELEDIFLPLSDMGLDIDIYDPFKNGKYVIEINKLNENEHNIHLHHSVDEWKSYVDRIHLINNELKSIIKRIESKYNITDIVDSEMNDDGEWSIPNIRLNLSKR